MATAQHLKGGLVGLLTAGELANGGAPFAPLNLHPMQTLTHLLLVGRTLAASISRLVGEALLLPPCLLP